MELNRRTMIAGAAAAGLAATTLGSTTAEASTGGRTPSKDVVVDQVRDLVERRLSMRRYEGRRRFVLVDPADAMNPQAQNALLKTLEEPPAETTLVLVAANADALLPTIRSRCVRVAFAPRGDGGVGALVARARKRVKDADGELRDRPVVEAAAALDPANAATTSGSTIPIGTRIRRR